ncbi:hypothetical protein DFH27DRAFT_523015 [Peziza echinospora]|nr:hypothetical protein DFH27DRAFT_523015 [Peziza echinospora]
MSALLYVNELLACLEDITNLDNSFQIFLRGEEEHPGDLTYGVLVALRLYSGSVGLRSIDIGLGQTMYGYKHWTQHELRVASQFWKSRENRVRMLTQRADRDREKVMAEIRSLKVKHVKFAESLKLSFGTKCKIAFCKLIGRPYDIKYPYTLAELRSHSTANAHMFLKLEIAYMDACIINPRTILKVERREPRPIPLFSVKGLKLKYESIFGTEQPKPSYIADRPMRVNLETSPWGIQAALILTQQSPEYRVYPVQGGYAQFLALEARRTAHAARTGTGPEAAYNSQRSSSSRLVAILDYQNSTSPLVSPPVPHPHPDAKVVPYGKIRGHKRSKAISNASARPVRRQRPLSKITEESIEEEAEENMNTTSTNTGNNITTAITI